MRIVVVGLRGFPNIQGGVETHCEELFPRIAKMGHEVIVIRRRNFVKENPSLLEYKGVKFKDIPSPSISGLEAVVHTALGILYAKKVHADILHIQAIGPSIMIPLARLLGLRVVMTHHGPDYDRDKWGTFAKFILRLGERFAAIAAKDIISISTVISDILKEKYKRVKRVYLIFNGITSFDGIADSTDYLDSINLSPGKYILAVGRFVEEKRFDKLIEAYIKSHLKNYKLIIAGDTDYPTAYAHFLKTFALENEVIIPGIVKGEKLYQLYKHAALFVLPSSHEGLPITLLEAMACRQKVLVSDIPANKAVGLPEKNYFKLDDIEDMMYHIKELLNNGQTNQIYDLSKYDWDNIAKQTEAVYLTI
ncbi:glycosyltransferase family 4 protein [uncultured Parabacteroides sp.]|uniref:glycosyltransferase family 4 protein n=1 Tax=uncultured Parabacteroides sp. TaxID=512312 RepID=UPI00261D1688|nr:glycosyltransferase family 4 protein [uncultured Parabacteroides sp.]